MKIELVQLYFTVKPPGPSGVTTTSYTAKEYFLGEDERGITIRHRTAPDKMLRVPWANVCGVWYHEEREPKEAPFRGPQPPPNDAPPEGGRFRKAG